MTNKEFAQWMLKVRAWRKSVDNLFQKGDDAAIERKNQWIEDLASVPFDVACQFLVDVRRGLTPGPENWETSELPRFVRSYSNRMENKKIQAAQHNRFRAEQSQAFSAVMADKSIFTPSINALFSTPWAAADCPHTITSTPCSIKALSSISLQKCYQHFQILFR